MAMFTPTYVDEELTAFWNEDPQALLDGETVHLHNGILSLFGLKRFTTLFIRESYKHLHLEIEAACIEDENVIITGTPGVGKSCFMIYMLYKARQEGCQDILVQIGNTCNLFSYESKNVSYVPESHVALVLRNPKVRYYYDPAAKGEGPLTQNLAFTVVFASPMRRNFGIIVKEGYHRMFYLPVWTLEEILECRRLCYPSKDEKEVQAAFNLWGGSARSIFCDKGGIYMRSKLDAFLTSSVLKTMLSTMENINKDANHDDKMLWIRHVVVGEKDGKPDYTTPIDKWPSDYVLEKVKVALEKQEENWREKAATTDSILLGRMFEYDVLKSFKSSTLFTVENITTREEETLKVSKTCYFQSQSVFTTKVDEETLYIPVEPNKKSVDFVMPPWLFQVTLRKTHSILGEGIAAISKQFSRDYWKLVFCIPQCNYDRFKPQHIKDLPPGITISQYVMAYPSTPQSVNT